MSWGRLSGDLAILNGDNAPVDVLGPGKNAWLHQIAAHFRGQLKDGKLHKSEREVHARVLLEKRRDVLGALLNAVSNYEKEEKQSSQARRRRRQVGHSRDK